MSADKTRNTNSRRNVSAGLSRRSVTAALLAFCAALTLMAAGCAGARGGRTAPDGGSGDPAENSAGTAGGRADPADNADDGKISVVTTIFPPYDFVREIAGDEADIKMLLKPGEETHSYEPTPQDIIAIQNSDVFIYTGGENDVWVEDILSSMPDSDLVTLRLVDCVETVEEEQVEGMKGSAGHDHDEEDYDDVHGGHTDEADEADGEDEEESPHEADEHVWTSPVNASLIAEQIKNVLSKADPDNRGMYEENTLAYQEQLAELDGQFREVVDHAKRNIMIFGDRFPFRYFADEYGLEYYAAFPGCAGDTEPSAATMAFLIEKVKEEKVPAVLKMELSSADIANAIAEATGTEVKVFYSCHNLSADDFENGETYLSMMQKNVETLKEVLN
ncbi:MAG TPA: metal ABC transporter substrate-binding protein [Candidatus Mediterraneibacter faecavium]|uniref:Metal ABC transporter substrate-binding protein n=1 Tax=Candidatus Mediterraneibacter faecavium TaxID=2838668 RepID=A0A9D2Q9G9_9FIRM|nr:metal ABC transporter substrate-binding protein [Candidatus Mediterraneibacter faecavium]